MDEPTNQIVQGRYRLLRSVGEGSQGRVYLAEDLGRGGEQVAVKLVEAMVGGHRDNSADDILRWFRHPNWAPVLDGGNWGADGWFQVSRFIRGSNLDCLEGPQPESWIWRFLECGARVLGAMHRQDVIHYDITPGNWMVEERGGEPNFVLTDGGLAHKGPVRGLGRGTPRFMAPEVTQDGEHDHRADLYSLGLIAFRLATGRDPFEGRAGEVLGKRRRLPAPRARMHRPDLDSNLDKIIASLLEREPTARPESGGELLERIRRAAGREMEIVTTQEAAAMAEGGPIEGRQAVVDEFRATAHALSARLRSDAPFVQRDLPRMSQSVTLLAGPRGSGTSRLALELQAVARDHGLPVLSIGHGTSPETKDVDHILNGLLAGVRALEGETDEPRVTSRPERLDRKIENLIAHVERTARATPFVILALDYSTLPPDAQRVIEVLTRFMLARQETARGTHALSVSMVVDVGASTLERLTLADSDDPQRSVVALGPISATVTKTICESRIPHLHLESQDCEIITEHCEGRPGRLVAALGEGLRRGDLVQVDQGWAWDLSELADYDQALGLSPRDRVNLAQCSRHELEALQLLAVSGSGLPASVVMKRLGERGSLDTVRELVGTTATGTVPCPSRAIADAVAAKFSSTEVLALAEWAREEPHVTATTRAHFELAAGHPDIAVQVLLDSTSPSDSARALLTRAVAQCPPLDSSTLERCASWATEGHESLLLCEKLAAHIRGDSSWKAASSVATVLERHGQSANALGILTQLDLSIRSDVEQHALRIRCAGLALHIHDTEAAIAHVRAARHIRRTARSLPLQQAAEAAAVTGTLEFFASKPHRARWLFTFAVRSARRAHARECLAISLNGLGIAEHTLGNDEAARRHLTRAAALFGALGDVNGMLRAQFNQARVAHQLGDLAQGAANYQLVATLAVRHRRNEALSRTLRALGHLYDQRLNSKLALRTLLRALREAENNQSEARLANAAWDIAPLAAAVGDLDTCRSALAISARHVRRMPSSFSRAQHHVVRGFALLHTGDPARAAHSFQRAQRHKEGLPEETLTRLHLLGLFCDDATSGPPRLPQRPERLSSDRDAYRVLLWATRVRSGRMRENRICVPAPSSLLPSRGNRPGVPGWIRRSYAELLLLAAHRGVLERASTLIGAMERNAQHSGESYLHARLVASLCLLAQGSYQPIAQMFSRCVAALPAAPKGRMFLNDIPSEHARAAIHLSRQAGLATAPPNSLLELHAVAHFALLQSGGVAIADDRVSTALRNVLEATTLLNAGGELDPLLDTITRQVIEITGAERACVIRTAPDGSHVVTTASTSRHAVDENEIRPVSETVIARTMEARRPLLLHDVFDDEELMQRPSITSLSLRSIICVPIIRGDAFFGVIYADDASAAAAFDQVDLEILSLYAEQVAGMLEARRLLENLQDSMRDLKTAQERLVRGERLRVMGEISSGVAHEFNNLLTGILARVQLARLGPIPKSLSDDLELIEKAALDAAEIVRRLQSFSRSERRRGFAQLDFSEICRDAIEFLRPLWAQRKVDSAPQTVRLIHDGSVSVLGDPTELREVVTNLLKNSLDATELGGLVELRLSSNQECALLDVSDDGCGIPEDVQARIFDPFFTTKGERGTGLGLALCQQIADRHGGQLAVSSTVGRGTTMSLSLPLADSARAGHAARLAEGEQARNLSILVVDDDPDVRVPLAEYLARSGHQTASASSAEEALQLLQQQTFDAALVDVFLPGMSGLAFCAELRAQSRPSLAVVLMSGRADELDEAKVRGAGATSLLPKPFAMRSVERLLSSVAVK